MAGHPETLRYIGYYRNHQVRFFHQEGEEKPWRFVFEDTTAAGKPPKKAPAWSDQPEPDIESAKSAALKLARERYGGFAEEKWDEWLDLSDEM